MTTQPLPWYAPLVRAVRVGSYLLAHAAIAAVFIVLLALVSKLLAVMGNPRLFGRVPVAYIFDAMDCMTLLVFATFGTAEAVTVFRDRSGGSK